MDVFTLLILSLFVLPSLILLVGTIVQAVLDHKKEMAEIAGRTHGVKGLVATPEEVERQRLAQELLEAHDEAGQGLRNDK